MFPDLNRLRIFCRIYRSGSIVATAEHFHLTQPAISQQLGKLEAELKVALFTRLHKKLVPTAAGERLFTLCAPLLQQLEEGLPAIREPLVRPSGLLRIGAPREFGKEFLPRFCKQFRDRYPDVSFRLRFKEAVPLLDMLRTGVLDFALVDVYFQPGELPGFPDIFSIDPLLREQMVLACSADYFARHLSPEPCWDTLRRQDFVTDEDDPSILDLWFRHHFDRVPDSLNIVMTFDTHEALISGIKLGMGLGVATAHLIWEEIQQGEILVIGSGRETMVNMISLVQLQDKVPTLTEKTFRDFMLESMRQPEILERFQCVEQGR